MAETNATVNQKKIVDCYMPLVHSNSSSINIDDSLSGVDDPIPIIDFSMLISDDPDKQFKTTQDLRNACLEYGSFMVINHELPDNLIIRVYEALGKFFDLRKEEKQEYETNDPTDMIRWGKWDSNLLSTEFIKMVVINHELPDKLIIRVYEALGKFFDLRKEEKQEYETNDPTDMIRWGKWDSNLLSTEFIKMVVHPTFHCPTKLAGLRKEEKQEYETNDPTDMIRWGKWDSNLLSTEFIKMVVHPTFHCPTKLAGLRISLPLFLGPSLDTTVSPMPEFVDEHHPPAYLVKTYKESLETNPYQ
ncbi:leucoanthocyanidin dioxygenase, partial [Quercus suber]